MTAPLKSKLDANQVLQHAFDDSTGRLRTDTEITVSGPPTALTISHIDDSIRLGDGTNFLSSTTVGPKVGLDANIISSTLPSGAATSANQITTNSSLSSIDSKLNPLTSIIRSVVSISTTAINIDPIVNQKWIRIVPLDLGNFYWGPDNAINSSNSELFNLSSPIQINTNQTIYVIKDTGTTNVVVYQGIQ